MNITYARKLFHLKDTHVVMIVADEFQLYTLTWFYHHDLVLGPIRVVDDKEPLLVPTHRTAQVKVLVDTLHRVWPTEIRILLTLLDLSASDWTDTDRGGAPRGGALAARDAPVTTSLDLSAEEKQHHEHNATLPLCGFTRFRLIILRTY